LRNLIYAWAPDRIVVGGGVSHLSGFHVRLWEELDDQLAGYPGVLDTELISPPALGDRSGLVGAYLLSGGPR
jgi:predicted NBD/HSP70 family sugar kinase